MKSDITEEMKNINNYYKLLNINEEKRIVFKLPLENSLRTLIKYKKNSITNLKYPRKYNEIKKKNL